MTKLKMLPMAVTMLGLSAGSSFAEIKLTDNLSTSGFLDMSISGAKDSTDNDATLKGSFDQFELDFMYKYGNISARADVNATPAASAPGVGAVDSARGATASTVYLEQGFVTYTNGGFGVGAGRFLSSSGFEAAEPTGLFQYSTSKTLVYGYYQNGINLSYTTPMFGLYGAVVSDLWNPQEFEMAQSPGFEGQISVMPVAGVTAKAAFLYQMYDTTGTGGTDDAQSLANVWAQYAAGSITAAAEFNYMMDWAAKEQTDLEGFGFLVMANYKFTDLFATTLRYSAISLDDKIESTDDYDSEVTLSPSLLLAPNLLSLAEARYDILSETFSYAVEATFTF